MVGDDTIPRLVWSRKYFSCIFALIFALIQFEGQTIGAVAEVCKIYFGLFHFTICDLFAYIFILLSSKKSLQLQSMIKNLNQVFEYLLKRRYDEDTVDRLTSRITPYFLYAIGAFIFFQQYSGNPLTCWSNASWNKSWQQYARDYCFIEGSHFVPMNQSLPKMLEHQKKVKYYQVPLKNWDNQKMHSKFQWVPFVFMVMGLMLQFPRLLWSFVTYSSSKSQILHVYALL